MNSRGLLIGRSIFNGFMSSRRNDLRQQAKRASHVFSYRVAPPPHSKATSVGAELVGAAMWWWVLWHLFHEYEHITGEFEYPKPLLWTNTELGIPTDDHT